MALALLLRSMSVREAHPTCGSDSARPVSPCAGWRRGAAWHRGHQCENRYARSCPITALPVVSTTSLLYCSWATLGVEPHGIRATHRYTAKAAMAREFGSVYAFLLAKALSMEEGFVQVERTAYYNNELKPYRVVRLAWVPPM